ncbi:MAG: cupin domain-containing protein [Nanoarchaeota archaeon]|nr:cupin domain-containing protein [Nanoarchaeota archaeon]
MDAYKSDIEKETLENTDYRRVLFTDKQMQLVVMSLKPGEEIPEEIHDDINQFFRVEKGQALAIVGENEFNLEDDDVLIVPCGEKHYVKNTSESEDLKIYTIYSPPEHPEGTVHVTKAEADAAEHEH